MSTESITRVKPGYYTLRIGDRTFWVDRITSAWLCSEHRPAEHRVVAVGGTYPTKAAAYAAARRWVEDTPGM